MSSSSFFPPTRPINDPRTDDASHQCLHLPRAPIPAPGGRRRRFHRGRRWGQRYGVSHAEERGAVRGGAELVGDLFLFRSGCSSINCEREQPQSGSKDRQFGSINPYQHERATRSIEGARLSRLGCTFTSALMSPHRSKNSCTRRIAQASPVFVVLSVMGGKDERALLSERVPMMHHHITFEIVVRSMWRHCHSIPRSK